jgi:hypothetical protein
LHTRSQRTQDNLKSQNDHYCGQFIITSLKPPENNEAIDFFDANTRYGLGISHILDGRLLFSLNVDERTNQLLKLRLVAFRVLFQKRKSRRHRLR